MKVYSYSSFKGSVNGYQYAIFDLCDEYAESILVDDFKGKAIALPLKVKEWFEQKNNWKLVLIKTDHEQGYLLISKIENARKKLWQKEVEKAIEYEASKEFRNNDSAIQTKYIDMPDSDFFINLAFEGSIYELRRLTAAIILEMNIHDEGQCFFDDVERAYINTLEHKDKQHYYIDVKLFRLAVNNLTNQLKEKIPKVEVETNTENAHFFTRLLRRFTVTPYIEIRKDSSNQRRNVRENRIYDILNHLISTEPFSENILVFISNGADLNKYGMANISFDINYLS